MELRRVGSGDVETSVISKFLVLGVISLLLGLPVNSLFCIAALALFTFVVAAGELRPVTPHRRRLAALVVICLAVKYAPPANLIEEGYNLFVPNQANMDRIYTPLMPAHVLAAFLADYSRENGTVTCDRQARFPWGSPAPCMDQLILDGRLFARSADDLFRTEPFSRRLGEVEVGAGKPFAADIFFDPRWAWHIFVENPNRTPVSFYSSYRIPSAWVGGTLCWKGSIYWEGRRTFELAEQERCRSLQSPDTGDRLWILQANQNRPLEIRISPPAVVSWVQVGQSALLVLLLAIGLSWVIVLEAIPGRALAIYLGSVALLLASANSFLLELPGNINHRDAVLYLSWGREIALALVDGDIGTALRGGESIYLFMPGMRYFRAAEFFVFGSSGYGHALFVSFLPLALYWLTRELKYGDLLFVALVALSSTKLIKALRTAADGYSDPLGLLVLVLALLCFMRSSDSMFERHHEAEFDARIATGFLLLGTSIFIRPNYVLVGIFFCVLWFIARARSVLASPVLLEFLGILLVLWMPLHNFVFGDRFVPLTLASTVEDALLTPPAAYLGAMQEILVASPGHNAAKVANKLVALWWPAHWLLFFVPLAVALLPIKNRPLRMLAATAVLLQVPHLFYRGGGREMLAGVYLGMVALLGGIWLAWSSFNSRAQSRTDRNLF